MGYESVIQFEKYFVNRIDFEINPEFEKESATLQFDIDNKVEVDKENGVAIVSISCEVFPNHVENGHPFHLVVDISGLFSFKDKGNATVENLLCKNGLAILFPYLRATITTITGTTGFPPLTLPTININSYLSKKTQEDNS